jgi:hypothetical protein
MECPNCGQECASNARYCSGCGCSLNKSAQFSVANGRGSSAPRFTREDHIGMAGARTSFISLAGLAIYLAAVALMPNEWPTFLRGSVGVVGFGLCCFGYAFTVGLYADLGGHNAWVYLIVAVIFPLFGFYALCVFLGRYGRMSWQHSDWSQFWNLINRRDLRD